MTREEYVDGLILSSNKSRMAFAKISGIPYTTLQRLLRPGGIMSSTANNIVRLCKHLHISVSDLLLSAEFPPSDSREIIDLQPHEKEIIKQYRAQLHMQCAVDRLLQIENKSSTKK